EERVRLSFERELALKRRFFVLFRQGRGLDSFLFIESVAVDSKLIVNPAAKRIALGPIQDLVVRQLAAQARQDLNSLSERQYARPPQACLNVLYQLASGVLILILIFLQEVFFAVRPRWRHMAKEQSE